MKPDVYLFVPFRPKLNQLALIGIPFLCMMVPFILSTIKVIPIAIGLAGILVGAVFGGLLAVALAGVKFVDKDFTPDDGKTHKVSILFWYATVVVLLQVIVSPIILALILS